MQFDYGVLSPLGLTIISILVTIIATWAISRWYYQKGIMKGLTWTAEVDRLVDSRKGILSEVKLSYKGAKLQQPRVEKVYIWNSGNQTISMADVSNADPLRLTYQSARVIDVYDIEANKTSVRPQIIEFDRSEIKFAFDYLDPGDGVRFSVLADANKKLWGSAGNLSGSIRGSSHSIIHEQYYNVAHPRSLGGVAGGLAFSSIFFAVTFLLCIDIYTSFAWTAFDVAKILSVVVTGIVAIASFGFTFENQFKSNKLPNALLRQPTAEISSE